MKRFSRAKREAPDAVRLPVVAMALRRTRRRHLRSLLSIIAKVVVGFPPFLNALFTLVVVVVVVDDVVVAVVVVGGSLRAFIERLQHEAICSLCHDRESKKNERGREVGMEGGKSKRGR